MKKWITSTLALIALLPALALLTCIMAVSPAGATTSVSCTATYSSGQLQSGTCTNLPASPSDNGNLYVVLVTDGTQQDIILYQDNGDGTASAVDNVGPGNADQYSFYSDLTLNDLYNFVDGTATTLAYPSVIADVNFQEAGQKTSLEDDFASTQTSVLAEMGWGAALLIAILLFVIGITVLVKWARNGGKKEA